MLANKLFPWLNWYKTSIITQSEYTLFIEEREKVSKTKLEVSFFSARDTRWKREDNGSLVPAHSSTMMRCANKFLIIVCRGSGTVPFNRDTVAKQVGTKLLDFVHLALTTECLDFDAVVPTLTFALFLSVHRILRTATIIFAFLPRLALFPKVTFRVAFLLTSFVIAAPLTFLNLLSRAADLKSVTALLHLSETLVVWSCSTYWAEQSHKGYPDEEAHGWYSVALARIDFFLCYSKLQQVKNTILYLSIW